VASPFKLSQRIVLALVPPVAALLIRALYATLRMEAVSEPGAIIPFDNTKPCIYAFWHRSLLIATPHFSPVTPVIIVSRSFDGELIVRTTNRFGYSSMRGSSSRNGADALIGLLRALKDGQLASITVDGPRGPAYVAKPGIVTLAQKSGLPISFFYIQPQRAWLLRSWDRFIIPKPFSRCVVTYAAPVPVTADAAAMLAQVQSALDRSVAMAEEYWKLHP